MHGKGTLLCQQIRQRWALLSLVFLTSAVVPILSMLTQVYAADVLADLLGREYRSLSILLELMAGLSAAAIGSSLLSSFYVPRVIATLTNTLNARLHGVIASRNVPSHLLERGEVSSRISSDIPTLVSNGIGILTTVAQGSATVIFLLLFGVHASVALTFVWILSTPLYLLPMIFRRKLQELTAVSRRRWGEAVTGLMLTAGGADLLKNMVHDIQGFLASFTSWSEVRASATREGVAKNLVGVLQNSIQILMVLAILFVAATLVFQHSVSVASAIAFLLLQQRIGPTVISLSQIGIMAAYIDLSEQRLAPYFSSALYELPTAELPPHVSVRLRDAAICAPGRTLIANCGLELPRHGIVLVTGENGAGKTQLLRALLGFIPTSSGTITWATSFSGSVAYVPQDVAIFRGTLMENVVLGRPVERSRLEKTLRQLGLHESELQTAYGDDSVLSGGERKRVGLARALVGDAKAIVVDEIESGVSEPERLIDALTNAVPLVVAVTHRPELWPITSVRYVVRDGELSLGGSGCDANEA